MTNYKLTQMQVDKVIKFRNELLDQFHNLDEKDQFRDILVSQIKGIEFTLEMFRICFNPSNVKFSLDNDN